MAKPQAVLAAAKKANELIAQLGQDTPPVGDPPVEPAAPVEPIVQPSAVEPTLAPPAPPAAEPPPTTPRTAEEELRHSIDVMAGRHRADVDRLQNDLANAYRQISDLTIQLSRAVSAIQAQPAPGAPAAPESPAPATFEFVQREFPEINQVMDHKIKQAMDSHFSSLAQRVESIDERTSQTLGSTFLVTVNREVPDWKVVNDDPRFAKWLSAPDAIGRTLLPVLQAAWKKMDAPTVISIFKEYKRLTSPAPAPNPAGYVPPPTTPASTTPSAPASAPVISRQDVTAFYADVSRGRYRDKPEEYKRLTAMIDAAMRAGTIK